MIRGLLQAEMHRSCTDHALACGEPLAGTAALAKRHLFICWPKRYWRRPRFETVGLSAALRAQMIAASGNGRYVGMVDGAPLELLSFPDAMRIAPRDQDHAADIIEKWCADEGFIGVPTRRTVLCCTDAKRDACCARYGFPVFKALAAAAPRFGIDVLQCTHIGGCHLAPSVIVMPDRQRYGRLTPEGALDFLSTIARNEIYLPFYKGNSELNELEQSAEVAARVWAQGRGSIMQIRIIQITMHSNVSATIKVQINAETLLVQARLQDFPIYGNCRDMDGDPEETFRWVARSVLPYKG